MCARTHISVFTNLSVVVCAIVRETAVRTHRSEGQEHHKVHLGEAEWQQLKEENAVQELSSAYSLILSFLYKSIRRSGASPLV